MTTRYNDRELIRAAVALNNAAVSLLRKGHSTKALRLFKTVVAFLQQFAKTSVSQADLDDAVRQASVQVASSAPMKKRPSSMQVQVLDDDDENAKHRATTLGPSSSLVFVVRLNDLCEQECNVFNFQYLTVNVLFNFGMAYRCGGAESDKNMASLLSVAKQTWETAKFLLLGCAEKSQELFHRYRWQVLLSLLRNSMVEVSRLLQEPESLPSMQFSTESLIAVEEGEFISQFYLRLQTAAPAA